MGDLLRTQHEATFEWGNYQVENVIIQTRPVYRAEINGKVVRATLNHRLHVDGRWQYIQHLGVADGEGEIVKLTVADAHTYVSNGVLSHNWKPDNP